MVKLTIKFSNELKNYVQFSIYNKMFFLILIKQIPNHISCSQWCRMVWGNEPTHSQLSFHFGSWSPNGLSNFQKAITGVKIHWIKKFLIPLKISWNLDVYNGLARPIWILKTQVMAERRARNQIVNLNHDH
jgi:hypothetical protein